MQSHDSTDITLNAEQRKYNDSVEGQILQSGYQNQKDIFQSLVKENPNIDLKTIFDKKKSFSLLHITALNQYEDLLQFIVEYEYQKYLKIEQYDDKNKEQFEKWINNQTSEGFTAIHFASFRGNLRIIQYLESKHANYHIKNFQGLNVLHIAAQGDQPISLAYFQQKNMNLNEIDNKGSTPLHWACYIGSENSVNFLCSWNIDVNIADKEGQLTPLHLASMNEFPRIIRKLLIKGANKQMKDVQGKTALQICQENDFEEGISMLSQKTNIFMQMCNLKPILQPMHKQIHQLFFFFFLFIACNTIEYLFIFPFLIHYFWLIIFILEISVTITLILLSWLLETGVKKKKGEVNMCQLILNSKDINQICFECQIIKPQRSKHCEICHKCISVYDHHCPWINNCVGAKNHGIFLSMLYCVWIDIIFLITLNILNIFCNTQYYYFIMEWNNFTHHQMMIAKYAVAGIVIIIGVFFILPLTLLIGVQTKNFMQNQTTSERFGRKNINIEQQSKSESINLSIGSLNESKSINQLLLDKSINFQNQSKLKNCMEMCYLNRANIIFQTSDIQINDSLVEQI